MEIPEGEERKKRTEEIFVKVLTKNFPQINVRLQAIDPGSSESLGRINVQKTTPRHSFSN